MTDILLTLRKKILPICFYKCYIVNKDNQRSDFNENFNDEQRFW